MTARRDGRCNLSGRTFYADLNKDGKLDNSEPTAKTNSSGNYTFSNLAAGKTPTAFAKRCRAASGCRSPSAWFYDVTITGGSKS